MIAFITSVLEMAGRNGVAASSTMAMENLRLIRLESRIHAFLSESRERLLHMQVLRGVLNRERMLLRITAQERDMASLKKEQRQLQVNCFSGTDPLVHSIIIASAVYHLRRVC